MLAEGVKWFDDWFAIENVASGVHAIGEPQYHWHNWNYLIEGRDGALLFDTGPGIRDIVPAAASLTSKTPVALPSHMHFDHTGNLHRFSHIAFADLPMLRAHERDGLFRATDDLYLGHWINKVWTPIRVTSWLPIGHRIELGGKHLEIIHTPGHSPDSISLWDADANILLAADFVYPGDLYAQVPGSCLRDYLNTADQLVSLINDQTRIYCAHGKPDNHGRNAAPMLERSDILDLRNALLAAKKSGNKSESIFVNQRMSLIVDDRSYASWQAC